MSPFELFDECLHLDASAMSLLQGNDVMVGDELFDVPQLGATQLGNIVKHGLGVEGDRFNPWDPQRQLQRWRRAKVNAALPTRLHPKCLQQIAFRSRPS